MPVTLHSPSGSTANLKERDEVPSLLRGWDGWDEIGWDGISKTSFKSFDFKIH